jgi:hypothetical protein
MTGPGEIPKFLPMQTSNFICQQGRVSEIRYRCFWVRRHYSRTVDMNTARNTGVWPIVSVLCRSTFCYGPTAPSKKSYEMSNGSNETETTQRVPVVVLRALTACGLVCVHVRFKGANRGLRQYVPPKCWYPSACTQGVKTQKTGIDTTPAVKTSNLVFTICR